MKKTTKKSCLTVYRYQQPTYPNAADARYFAGKLLDIITAIVSGMGFITAMICLVILN